MLTVLGGLAEFERELICARTGQGRKRAKGEALRVYRSAPPSCVLRHCQKLLL
jgi:DNA invertase Pin-like site-specific DNA recombinase